MYKKSGYAIKTPNDNKTVKEVSKNFAKPESQAHTNEKNKKNEDDNDYEMRN